MPKELLQLFSEEYVIVLKKTGKTMCYLSVNEYLQFQNYLIMTVKGFISSNISDFRKFTVNKEEGEEDTIPTDNLRKELERITEILDFCHKVIELRKEKNNEIG